VARGWFWTESGTRWPRPHGEWRCVALKGSGRIGGVNPASAFRLGDLLQADSSDGHLVRFSSRRLFPQETAVKLAVSLRLRLNSGICSVASAGVPVACARNEP